MRRGTCVCDDESCNGCCDGTTCKGGGADGACGSGGEDCRECASFETCQDGTCETHNRAVSVSFELFDEWLTSCYLTVHVTGFVPGTYTGFADFGIQMDWEFSIEVGAEGTGMWTSRPYRIWSQDGNVTVTVDGVSSVDAPVTC